VSEFDDFNAADDAARAAAPFDPSKASEADLLSFVSGEGPDLEAQVRLLKAARDAAEIKELTDFARQNMKERGWDEESRTWRVAEPEPEDLSAPVPAEWVVGPDGQPMQGAVISPERFAAYAQDESPIGRLSDEQFEAFLAARDAGKDRVFGNEPPDAQDVNELYHRLGSERG
jgi:hypothetical protein